MTAATAVWLLDAAGLADRLSDFVETPGFPPMALFIAFLAGAAHAVQPGHGKTLTAAFLVGADGRPADAARLGISVAVMHTFSALVIALAWTFLNLSDWMPLATLTGGLSLLAGLVVVLLGMLMFRAWNRRRVAGGHGHGHGHGHGGHGHGHGHLDQGAQRPGLWLLAVSGGLVPSPAAFLLLVTGIFSGRSEFALVLVAVFGFGMAVVLFGVGLLALTGRDVVLRWAAPRSWTRSLSLVGPLLAAVGVTTVGCVLTTTAFVNLTG